jgi:hypothetical protein
VAVYLLPGTELAFEKDVKYNPSFGFFSSRKTGQRVARFRHINEERPSWHHDALEFPIGDTVLVTRLCEGQHATVLQLPASRTSSGQENERSHHFRTGAVGRLCADPAKLSGSAVPRSSESDVAPQPHAIRWFNDGGDHHVLL